MIPARREEDAPDRVDPRAAPLPDDATLLCAASRWVRVLFERRRLGAGSAPTGEAAPAPASAAVHLAGARPAAHLLGGTIAALRDGLWQRAELPAGGRECPLRLLRRRFSLDPLEADLLLLLCAYQADTALWHLRPPSPEGARLSLGLVSELLAPAPPERAQVLARLGLLGPLRRYQLVRVGAADQGPGALGRGIEAHERIVEFLLGDDGFDGRLAATARLLRPAEPQVALPYPPEVQQALRRATAPPTEGGALPILLHGADRGGKEALLALIAGERGRPVLSVDLAALAQLYQDPDVSLQEHLREAVLHDALLYVDAHAADELPAPLRLRLGEVLARGPGGTAIGCVSAEAAPLPGLGPPLWIRVGLPDAEARGALWRRFLREGSTALPRDEILGDVARRFILGHDAIRDAARECLAAVAVGPDRAAAPSFEQLCRAGRRRQSHQLGKWAQRIECTSRWEDLVAAEEATYALWSMVLYVRHSDQVFGRWGFSRRWSRGAGLSSLFFGPPGTGKTMAASLIARELEMDLFRVDLSKVTSMWIGETEKHLGEIFEQARLGHAVLLFDEADSLFAKRTEVRTSVDRYANLGVNFLLQMIEEFSGVCILTTNKPENLDEAFKRRLRFEIEFALPDEPQRRLLWETMIPKEAEIAEPLSLDRLAQRYVMGGGNIQNAILRAAFLAAEARQPIDDPSLFQAADEEYQALGKLVRSA